MNPTISIVMPCFNSQSYVVEAIESILNQTFTAWELIAVNDGSFDDTEAVLRSFEDDRIRVFSQANQGVSSARNRGIELARGRYIAFLDSDDWWAPTALEKLFAALEANEAASLAYCGWQNIGAGANSGRPYVPPDYELSEKFLHLLTACPWPIHAALVKLSAARAAGGFDTGLRTSEDYRLWLDIAVDAPIVRVPEVLAFYRHHGAAQATADCARAALDQLHVQEEFLARHPAVRDHVGIKRCAALVSDAFRKQALQAYWQRNLPAARVLFRHGLGNGHLRWRDLPYALPALLPEWMHRWMLQRRDRGSAPVRSR